MLLRHDNVQGLDLFQGASMRCHLRALPSACGEGYGTTLSRDRLAHRLDVDPVHVRWAVDRLVELGLMGVERGSGARAKTYLLALPRRVAASMQAAVADDAPPF